MFIIKDITFILEGPKKVKNILTCPCLSSKPLFLPLEGPKRIKKILTCPCLSSEILFVSFNLWKETTFCIHCSPVAGLSGWMYILFGISGSAFPATTQDLKIKEKKIKIYNKISLFIWILNTSLTSYWKRIISPFSFALTHKT